MSKQDTFIFGSEIPQLISLARNAFYPDKEIFLRELILNAADALDKIRFMSVTGYDISKEPNLRIRIIPDLAHHTLSVIDTGIGMTRDELINKLVTIQKPGTKAFLEALKSGTDIKTIGPFNVGFYSAFLVADRVTVISKCDDEPIQCKWESTGEDVFTVSDDSENPEQIVRGTQVLLHLKEEDLKFLEEDKLKKVVRKRCDFIGFPIELHVKRTTIEESESEEETDEPKKKAQGRRNGRKN